MLVAFAVLCQTVVAPPERVLFDIPYRQTDDEYAEQMCRLDLMVPAGQTGFATVVWFHGGGLTAGQRSLPDGLRGQGFAVATCDYRLSPHVRSPAYIEDAAAAVAWTLDRIADHGGDPRKVFVAGHSAGGYLASMVGMDRAYLAAFDHHPRELAGLIPYSGHTITHFTVREERGIGGKQPIVDRMAPLFHVSAAVPPMLLITGDRDRELLGRYEETAYFWRMMQVVEHLDCELFELEGYDHGGMPDGAHPLLVNFVRRRVREIDEAKGE